MMLRRCRSFANYRFNFGMAINRSLENLIDWIGMRRDAPDLARRVHASEQVPGQNDRFQNMCRSTTIDAPTE